MAKQNKLPLVYACSGCSNVAQLANSLAVELDRKGLAEMSCISGVGGDVKPLVKKATSGRPIIAIDGCPLACAKHCLKRHRVTPDYYYELTQLNIKKRYHSDCSRHEFNNALALIANDIGCGPKGVLTQPD